MRLKRRPTRRLRDETGRGDDVGGWLSTHSELATSLSHSTDTACLTQEMVLTGEGTAPTGGISWFLQHMFPRRSLRKTNSLGSWERGDPGPGWRGGSMGFSWQEYWSGLPFPSPGDLPNPRIKHGSPAS